MAHFLVLIASTLIPLFLYSSSVVANVCLLFLFLGDGEVQVGVQQATLRLHLSQVPVGASERGARPHSGRAEHSLRSRGTFLGFETFLLLLFVHLNAVIRLPSCFQISRLEKDKEDLVAHYQGADPMRDGKRAEVLLREKTQLLLRLKGLEAEVTELHAQKENSGQQAESVQRIQIRQLSESQAALKALEVRLNTAACWSFCYRACFTVWLLRGIIRFVLFVDATGRASVLAAAAGSDGERASPEPRAKQPAHRMPAQSRERSQLTHQPGIQLA